MAGGLTGAIAILLAALAGTTLPDIDQLLPLLDHRSAITHSIAPAVAALGARSVRPVGCGLALGLGLHLSADCFPQAMIGYATIKLPLGGSLGRDSYWWLAGNAGLAGALFGWLLPRQLPMAALRWTVLGAGALLALWYLAQVPGGYRALACYALVAWAAWRIRAAILPVRD